MGNFVGKCLNGLVVDLSFSSNQRQKNLGLFIRARRVKPGILDYRKITPCEAAKLQAMPDKFCASIESDKSAYKQLGNAVNVGIVGLVFQVLAGENLLSKPLILPTKAVQLDL